MRHELLRTEWTEVASLIEWIGSTVVAYRIWKRCVDGVWQQRHEWRFENGETDLEDWIRGTQCHPAQHFKNLSVDDGVPA